MNKLISLVFAFTINTHCFSQIKYENGYFIDNTGSKTVCLIKNIDWFNNPKEFTYKLSADADSKKGVINEVAEFSIINSVKYVRFTVNIDHSSENINSLTTSAAPEFNKEQLFLKVLIEGKATLYSYISPGLTRFFYRLDSASVEQLIYKSYIDENNRILRNNGFRNQLLSSLQCGSTSANEVQKIDYKENDLNRFFISYNQCQNSNWVSFNQNKRKNMIHLSLRPGISFSGLSYKNILSPSMEPIEMGNKTTFRFGIESEFVLPFNKNKWSIIVEPAYQFYKSQKVSNNKTYEVDYSFIELPVGLRYSLFLNDHSKLFIDGLLMYDFAINSEITAVGPEPLNISSLYSGAFGIGYHYKNKFSLEARYKITQDLLGDYIYQVADYNNFSVIFGYRLF